MNRTPNEWNDYFWKNVTAGYTPGTPGVTHIWNNGQALLKVLEPFNCFRDGINMLDIGCANGRLAIQMTAYNLHYTGLDIIPGVIEFCKKAFAGDPRFSFGLLPVANNHYYGHNPIKPEKMVLPIENDCMDLVCCLSLFTHISPLSAVRNYLEEIHRVLRPGSQLCVTFLRSPPNVPTLHESRTVYLESEILDLLEQTKFEILHEKDGITAVPGDQWRMLCRSFV